MATDFDPPPEFDAATWILISAFSGLAIASETGWFPPWAGLLIGGGASFLIAVGILARS